MRFRSFLMAFIASALFSGSAGATSMVAFTEEDLAHVADVIVVADVVQVVPEPTTSANARRMITTRTSLAVVDSWKGPYAAGDKLTVRELGGVVGKEMSLVEGTAGFLVGERVLVYLFYRPENNEYGIVGWTQGKFSLVKSADGAWQVGKLSIPVENWGARFDAAIHIPRTMKGSDLSARAVEVRRIVRADAESGADWRDNPKYEGFSGRGKAKEIERLKQGGSR